MNLLASLPSQLLVVAYHCHELSILLFGYFIPALSSVKAVVRKDPEAYHQWSTYWLILHLYVALLSPFLHLTLHPIFQLLAILWLSLPQYQGASVVYERIVLPWVDRYESRVDDAVDEAHRGVRKWVWSRLGGVAWVLLGEGGNMAGAVYTLAMGVLGFAGDVAVQPSNANEASSLPPCHSLREALSQSSSFEDVGEGGDGEFRPSKEFVRDFLAMLEQGLYVFANADDRDASERARFSLCIFSYAKGTGGSFMLSSVATGDETNMKGPTVVRLPLEDMKSVRATGEQGLIMECDALDVRSSDKENATSNTVTVEIVLSEESDRNIMLNGLTACLPHR